MEVHENAPRRGPGQPRKGTRKTVILTDEQWDALDRLAARDDVPRNEIVRRIIDQHLAAHN